MSLFMPHGSNPQSAQFTCNTCGIRFASAELQRQHMKTEWHRYNLKRRVAELPSISSEVFAEKILNSKQNEDGYNESEEDEYGFYVHRRKVKQLSDNAQITKKLLKHHEKVRGRKHEQIILGNSIARAESPAASLTSEFSSFSLGDPIHHEIESLAETGSEIVYTTESDGYYDSEIEDDDNELETASSDSDDELEALPIDHCFFCGQNNGEIENNVKHMFNRHGLYIPERSFLTNIEGLLTYISEVITIDNECLVCGFVGKNMESIRQHVYSKGHCRIPYETKQEKLSIAEFYTFYDNDDDIQINNSKKRSKSTKAVSFAAESEDIEDIEDARDEESDVELEINDEEEDSIDDDDDDDINNGVNDNYSLVRLDRSGVELTLPTGSKIGHRSMARYYRQNIILAPELKESQKTVAIVDRRFASGLSYHQITKEERQIRKLEQRVKNNYERKVKGSHINHQKHFRDELLGPM
ncbi:C2H2 type zinc-finger-domain-containing protein [Scheffersomyces amazonensis]|uniref:C2H2 type zinc-finger-domain-containing protein n=1 Tax=Scheffersomyces amazonensis TaxID=1078765 RepID=UPI00315CA7E3